MAATLIHRAALCALLMSAGSGVNAKDGDHQGLRSGTEANHPSSRFTQGRELAPDHARRILCFNFGPGNNWIEGDEFDPIIITLDQDLDCTGLNARGGGNVPDVGIRGPGITLDCQGNKIISNRLNPDVVWLQDNAKLHNCVIEQPATATSGSCIRSQGAQNEIHGTQVTGCATGINIGCVNTNAVSCAQNHDTEVLGCTVTGSSQWGLRMDDPDKGGTIVTSALITQSNFVGNGNGAGLQGGILVNEGIKISNANIGDTIVGNSNGIGILARGSEVNVGNVTACGNTEDFSAIDTANGNFNGLIWNTDNNIWCDTVGGNLQAGFCDCDCGGNCPPL